MAERLRIAVLDDDARELERMRSVLEALGETGGEYFTGAEDLLRAAEAVPPFDVAFLDIWLAGVNGIGAAERLRAISPRTGLVFVTASREDAVDAFQLHALHYLVKPFSAEDVEALRRREAAHGAKRPSITVTVNRESTRVYLDDIVFIQSLRHAVEIRLADGQCLRVWQPISEVEGLLDRNFLKINRGLVINMDEVTHMGLDTCTMSDGTRLPVKKKDRAAIRRRYDDFLVNELHVMAEARRGGGK